MNSRGKKTSGEKEDKKPGLFEKGGPGGPGRKRKERVDRETHLAEYDTLTEKAYAILGEGLYANDKKERLECAKLLARLNPQEVPKDVLDVRAREIVEYWVMGNVVREDVVE